MWSLGTSLWNLSCLCFVSGLANNLILLQNLQVTTNHTTYSGTFTVYCDLVFYLLIKISRLEEGLFIRSDFLMTQELKKSYEIWWTDRLTLEGSMCWKINIDKSMVMRLSRSDDSLQIKVDNRELKDVGHFKYLGTVLERNGYSTKEIKMRIAIAKEASNRKISLLTRKLNIELRKKLVMCHVRSIALYGTETWTPRKLERKYLESF